MKQDACEVDDSGDYSITEKMARLSFRSDPDFFKDNNYFIDEEHGGLTARTEVLDAINDLLRWGFTERLKRKSEDAIEAARGSGRARNGNELAVERSKLLDDELKKMAGWDAQCRTRDVESVKRVLRSPQMREVEDLVTRDLLGPRAGRRRMIARTPTYSIAHPVRVRVKSRKIHDALRDSVGGPIKDDEFPIDAISIGQYLGEIPQGAEQLLDETVSRIVLKGDTSGTETDRLLSQFIQRNVIRGELGQLFFLNVPRDRSGTGDRATKCDDTQTKPASTVDQVVVVAGMGLPGRFGEPELTVLARELVWTLDRLGKRHLATAAIGTRNSNLHPSQAFGAWLLGLKLGLSASSGEKENQLRQITFFLDVDWKDYEEIRDVLDRTISQCEFAGSESEGNGVRKSYLEFRLEPGAQRVGGKIVESPPPKDISGQTETQEATAVADASSSDGVVASPTRVTFTYSKADERYKFGAITQDASVPEREISVNPKVIDEINNRLVTEYDREQQAACGLQLGINLVPRDLHGHVTGNGPLVLLLDSASSRIHWEMVAQPDPINYYEPYGRAGDGNPVRGRRRFFLGTSRGLTRQLQSTFAPPPEALPASRNRLRVLIVADPAPPESGLSLPGARNEGAVIAELFRRFNELNRGSRKTCEVLELIGPQEAERDLVLRELTLGHYDLLHFAGHCQYIEDKPDQSGWVFGEEKIISANELAPIGRIPKFVFSNACETGKIPEQRSPGLAPSFAESFFARGVGNFVCTAWPVADEMALLFAKTLYECLLGLPSATLGNGERLEDSQQRIESSNVMYEAMRSAREAVFKTPGGERTWGAYQHYGNPFCRLFPKPLSRN